MPPRIHQLPANYVVDKDTETTSIDEDFVAFLRSQGVSPIGVFRRPKDRYWTWVLPNRALVDNYFSISWSSLRNLFRGFRAGLDEIRDVKRNHQTQGSKET